MLRDDVSSAVRALRAKPGFALLIVVCLAIGIGANIAMFSIANVLFLRPPTGVRNADALMYLSVVRRSGEVQSPEGGPFSYRDFVDVENARRAFAGLAASRSEFMTVGHGTNAEIVLGEYVSADYLRVLGARIARGRFFAADEDSVRGLRPPTVVLGYNYWVSHFLGRDVVGRTLTINGRLFTIIGIAERGFQGAGYRRVDLWTPIVEMVAPIHMDPLRDRYMTALTVIGRRAPGVTAKQAAAAATAALAAGVATEPQYDQHPQVITRVWSDGIGMNGAPHGTLILWLFGAVGFVLAIACANVANLLLARAVQRRREIAVRLSLGIGRRRLARQALIESLILAVSGAAVGLLVAWWSTAVWQIPDLGRPVSPWDPTVLAFTLGLALATAIAFGVAPALVATKTDLSLLLKDGAQSASRRASGRSALIALQAALALVVLAGSGLFIRSLQKMSARDLGLDANHVVFVNPRLPVGPVDSMAQLAIQARVIARLAALPGVRAVSIEDIPHYRGIAIIDVKRPGPDSIPPEANGFNVPRVNFVGPSYAEALGAPIISGRDITAADRAGTQRVAVVSQRMARVYWPGRSPIGQCLLLSSNKETPTCAYVVGVAGDEGTSMLYYVPRTQRSLAYQPTIIVRTTGSAHAALQTIRDAVIQAAPEVLYAEASTVPMLLADQYAPVQLGALLFTIFGIAALGLTAIGLYGIVAYLVAQRTREVGIRMALGSTALGAVTLIARQGAKPVAVGLVVGLAGAFAVTRFLQHLLYNVSPTDGPSFAAAAGLLGLVAAAACVVPARKAAQVDPVVALRAE